MSHYPIDTSLATSGSAHHHRAGQIKGGTRLKKIFSILRKLQMISENTTTKISDNSIVRILFSKENV